MVSDRFAFGWLGALPFVAIALAAARPLHALPGHAGIGVVVGLVSVACLWRLAGAACRHGGDSARLLALAGGLLIAPWLVIATLWVGIGAPFQATNPENQHRYVVLAVDALLVGAGFMVLRDAVRERGERVFASASFAAAVPASGSYFAAIAITLAQATMAVQGDRTPFPPLSSHLYDVLEFFACATTYLCTALAVIALGRSKLLGRTGVRVAVGLCLAAVALLLARGIEYPDISGQTAPWYTQPGVIVRIPAIPWLLPGWLGALLLRRAAAEVGRSSA